MNTISFHKLTKRHGSVLAVDDLSFDVLPGRVTGLLGPNGAGKTTTLKILLGLATPTAGSATIGGAGDRRLPDPLRQVGAALDSNTFHPGRSATQHLKVIATAAGLPHRRVGEMLKQVGLAQRRAAESAATRWACASGSAWPVPCSATPACSSWTSR
jgi:ABC-2 type transport system ATP-binding protein